MKIESFFLRLPKSKSSMRTFSRFSKKNTTITMMNNVTLQSSTKSYLSSRYIPTTSSTLSQLRNFWRISSKATKPSHKFARITLPQQINLLKTSYSSLPLELPGIKHSSIKFWRRPAKVTRITSSLSKFRSSSKVSWPKSTMRWIRSSEGWNWTNLITNTAGLIFRFSTKIDSTSMNTH